mmetsp:Transcript_437/g.652  ORF Transcript_437/g.652 Transcript_437/m.652 type:complete len:126 (+) Transcript_437:114-491(+)|eukprot:CAMPEP_0113630838 /NCGR_PEP_ID=MMETSP0017_2-20120614/16023_1 /TAXON_ID=2856 /ORGANISM="Cylindrotheca closterium" /LENGTH=125 /DNA_ID=CAMNT_0000541319 /DNA_START=111 /DNA_END=488 /DNA_ORIENTATION=- /assembly_acc=CAM_ASM_000147
MLRLTSLLRSASSRLTNSSSIAHNNTLRCMSDITTKKEIIDEIAKNHDLSVAESGRILNTVLDTIVESVSDGKKVRLGKFGSFERFQAEARNGRNPYNGAPMYIPSKKRIRFKAYTSFKEMVNDE